MQPLGESLAKKNWWNWKEIEKHLLNPISFPFLLQNFLFFSCSLLFDIIQYVFLYFSSSFFTCVRPFLVVVFLHLHLIKAILVPDTLVSPFSIPQIKPGYAQWRRVANVELSMHWMSLSMKTIICKKIQCLVSLNGVSNNADTFLVIPHCSPFQHLTTSIHSVGSRYWFPTSETEHIQMFIAGSTSCLYRCLYRCLSTSTHTIFGTRYFDGQDH